MFGCFGFILAHLGFFFGLALQNVGLMLGCGCHHGVLMVSPSCRLGSVSGFVVLWVVGVLCLGSAGRDIGGMSVVIWWRLGGVSVMSWCNPAVYPFLLRRCVLVALGRACMCVMLCLRVILLVLRWRLSRTFVVYARSLACGCLAGVGMAFFGCESAACERSYGWILDISMVSCICAHGLATQYQSLHACGP